MEKVIELAKFKEIKYCNLDNFINKFISDPLIEPYFKVEFEKFLRDLAKKRTYKSTIEFLACARNELSKSSDVRHILLEEALSRL